MGCILNTIIVSVLDFLKLTNTFWLHNRRCLFAGNTFGFFVCFFGVKLHDVAHFQIT